MKLLPVLLTSTLLFATTAANAALLNPVASSATASVNNPTAFSDGTIPTEGGSWTVNTSYWNGTSQILSLDLGAVFNIEEILLSVDNNDNYAVEWSTDASSWTNLFNINNSYGEIGWGMDTMSTLSGHPEYISALDFSLVQAQFIRIFATAGDNSYSVGEFQVFGSEVSAVPLPAAAFMFAPALLGFMGLRRKAKNSLA